MYRENFEDWTKEEIISHYYDFSANTEKENQKLARNLARALERIGCSDDEIDDVVEEYLECHWSTEDWCDHYGCDYDEDPGDYEEDDDW